MSAKYNRYSPYHQTPQTWFLGQYVPVNIPPADDDIFMIIPQKYHERPWMLAHELYQNERLYYIFAITNMNEIQDPIYDFKVGTEIRVPTNDRVQRIIGGR